MQNVQNNSDQASTHDVCTSDNVRLQQHGIAQVDAKDAEIAKLKDKITSLESGGDKEIALEDKQFIKWMRDRLDVKDRKEVNDRWPWMLDKSISAINVPKKGA